MTSEETVTLTRREYEALIERNNQLEDWWPPGTPTTACVCPTTSPSTSCEGRVQSWHFEITRASP